MRVWAAALLGLAACSGGNGGFVFEGMVGTDIAAESLSDVLLVPSTIDGARGPTVAVDTGSPLVALTGDLRSPIARLDVLGVSFLDVDFSPLPAGFMEAVGGVVGCTILCDFAVAFDYRGHFVTLDDADLPTDLEPEIEVLMDRKGGGTGRLGAAGPIVTIPPSRLIVSAVVEGTVGRFMVDTGASITFVRGSNAATLALDQRPTASVTFVSQLGAGSVTMMRVQEIALGGARVEGALIGSSSSVDELLGHLAEEVGEPLDGIIGATFLRENHLIVDYPLDRLRFRRYPTQEHFVDPVMAVGIELAIGLDTVAGAFVTIRSVRGDAAIKGIMESQQLVRIQGQPVLGKTGRDIANSLIAPRGSSILIDTFCERDPRCVMPTSRMIRADQRAL